MPWSEERYATSSRPGVFECAPGPLQEEPAAPWGRERLRLDGKFLARGADRFRIHGVTYGPFAGNGEGEPFPAAERVADDFARMRDLGINSIRTYHLPPESLLQAAGERGLGVFVDVPWAKHLCFLDSRRAQADARAAVERAAQRGRSHACVIAYSIGNEIPPNIVRWHGAKRVERFLAELYDVAKQADPEGLVTYASYPPTEYLDLSFLDFATLNVYLHDRSTFRRYLHRVQNLVGDKPLLLGELGMDTLRHGEEQQARFLAGHLREVALAGLAGAFVFSWTDDWHTGGFAVEGWAFGITDRKGSPKASARAIRNVFRASPAALLRATPRVSVVVCTYNGARTLEQCLHSLMALDYPDYEIIVVNDGSRDSTSAIVSRFPGVRAIQQSNLGLSAARNAGLGAATGSIVAYTDDDCFADPDWLTQLVAQLERSDAAAVGGPNLTPEDGWLAACVGAAPGQPTHVLASDQVAEHVPGCNMAFRREALLAINGFDPVYRKAGDDVDVCWRLQQAGHFITFAPGASVWHHRRQNPRAYLRQQAGYGDAEAMLRFKHPDKFNGRGDSKWGGILYGNSARGLRLRQAVIYRGIFGSGPFQCLYQPAPAHWAMVPSTLEWQAVAVLAACAGFLERPLALLSAAMIALSLFVAVLQARGARLPKRYATWRSRLVVAGLCYLQPLVRSWTRYRTRYFAYQTPTRDPCVEEARGERSVVGRTRTVAYWTDGGRGRMDLLEAVVSHLDRHRWGKALDSGWAEWDLEIHCHPWTVVQVCTAEEDHGQGRRLIRLRYRLLPAGYTRILALGAAATGVLALAFRHWLPAGAALALAASSALAWWWGARRAGRALAVIDRAARALGMIPSPSIEPD